MTAQQVFHLYTSTLRRIGGDSRYTQQEFTQRWGEIGQSQQQQLVRSLQGEAVDDFDAIVMAHVILERAMRRLDDRKLVQRAQRLRRNR